MGKIFMTLYGPLETDARVLRSIAAAEQSGKKVVVATCNTKKGFYISDAVEIISFPFEGKGSLAFFRFCKLCFSFYITNKKEFEGVYLHDYYSTMVGILLLPFLGKRKMIYDAHELILPMPKEQLSIKERCFVWAELVIAKHVDLVIQANKEREKIFNAKYPKTKTMNVLNISKYPPQCGRVLNKENIVIVYQGIMSESRNLSFLIDVILSLPTNYSLLMIGDGPSLKMYMDKAKSLGVTHRVVFTGRLSNIEMMKRLEGCSIGVISYPFTSYNNIYCSPNKIFEYAAISLPFIATEQPFIREVQGLYNIGRTFKYGDKRSFIENVKIIIDNYDSYNNTQIFLEDYNYDKEICKMKEAFRIVYQ